MYFKDPSEVQSNNILTRTYVMRKDDIAFEGHPSKKYKFGRFVANDIGDGIVSELFPVYRHISKYDPKYWKYAIQIERIMAPLFAKSITSSGNSSNKLNPKHFLRQKVRVPNVKEQSKIGEFFSKLDSTITLHEEKQHQLEQLKKALLQKMFADKSGYPELRFKGFTDTWEQVQVSKLFTIKKNNTFSRSDLNFEGGSTKNVHYGDILVKYGEILDANSNNIPFITKDISSNFDNSYLQNGDIVMADTAEDETVGKSTEILNLPTNIKLLAGLHTIPLSPRRKFASGYLGFYLNSNSYHDTLRPLMQGIKVTSISKNELKKTVVCFPRKYIEQQKIGELFIKLNSTITLHAKKIEQLKRLKQALLQKMFV